MSLWSSLSSSKQVTEQCVTEIQSILNSRVFSSATLTRFWTIEHCTAVPANSACTFRSTVSTDWRWIFAVFCNVFCSSFLQSAFWYSWEQIFCLWNSLQVFKSQFLPQNEQQSNEALLFHLLYCSFFHIIQFLSLLPFVYYYIFGLVRLNHFFLYIYNRTNSSKENWK